jgi:hypothetical protein
MGRAEKVQLGEAKLLVGSIRSEGAPSRRFGEQTGSVPCGPNGGIVQGGEARVAVEGEQGGSEVRALAGLELPAI